MSSNWGNAQQNSEVYIQDREQTKDKHMETGGMITKKSAECVRNRSLVLQSPCSYLRTMGAVTGEGNFNNTISPSCECSPTPLDQQIVAVRLLYNITYWPSLENAKHVGPFPYNDVAISFEIARGLRYDREQRMCYHVIVALVLN